MTFEEQLEELRSQGFWLGELAEYRPASGYIPLATFRVVLYHHRTSTSAMGLGWGETPNLALAAAKLNYDSIASRYTITTRPNTVPTLTLKDLGL